MRKQMKIAAVVSAAALLALGASITSFAAQKGTWKYLDGEWYCYDKNGDVYTNTFCLNNGKEFYVGDDGSLVASSWVEYEGSYYFVNSAGTKIINDWRLTTPYDDENADEEWYYFQSGGKRAENKKLLIGGKTYFFNSDGKMLTGWVTADGSETVDESNSFNKDNTYYCDETGARLEKAWIKTTEPGTDDDDADADEYYYYLKSNGKAATSKQNNIKGQTYFFDTEGRMLTGWVAKTTTGSNADVVYLEIDDEGSNYEVNNFGSVYYCGEDDDGHMKKQKWIKLWRPKNAYDEDDDVGKMWYWLEKDGQVYVPSSPDATADKYKFEDGKLVLDTDNTGISVTKKKVNSKDFFFNEKGEMVTTFIDVYNVNNNNLALGMYYFGGSDDGSMKTGSQTIKDDSDESYKFYFATKSTTSGVGKGTGITGNQSGKLYYDGMLIKSDDYRYQVAKVDTLGNAKFIVNQNGSIQSSKSQYKEDGDVLIDATKETTNGSVTREITFNSGTTNAALKNSVQEVTGTLVNNVIEIDASAFVYKDGAPRN